MKHHVLKSDPAVFQANFDFVKSFEIRFNDRNFEIGDTVELQETCFSGEQMREFNYPLEYTGRIVKGTIEYILASGYGLIPGWIIFGIGEMQNDHMLRVKS